MIVMINGAFGVGKTTVAKGLLAGIPDSMLYDPEDVGQMLRTIDTCNRPAEANPRSWAFHQTARCVAAHQDSILSQQIQDYILTQL